MLAKKDDVSKLIPQKPPMVMVDNLLEQTDLYSISNFKIRTGNIFCDNGFLAEAGLIENMAQTAALRSGFESAPEKEDAQVGFIGSLKRIKILQLPKMGDIIETKINILNNLINVQIIKAEVFCDEKLIAEGEMNIFLQENN